MLSPLHVSVLKRTHLRKIINDVIPLTFVELTRDFSLLMGDVKVTIKQCYPHLTRKEISKFECWPIRWACTYYAELSHLFGPTLIKSDVTSRWLEVIMEHPCLRALLQRWWILIAPPSWLCLWCSCVCVALISGLMFPFNRPGGRALLVVREGILIAT